LFRKSGIDRDAGNSQLVSSADGGFGHLVHRARTVTPTGIRAGEALKPGQGFLPGDRGLRHRMMIRRPWSRHHRMFVHSRLFDNLTTLEIASEVMFFDIPEKSSRSALNIV
jgi:hypothetical protein